MHHPFSLGILQSIHHPLQCHDIYNDAMQKNGLNNIYILSKSGGTSNHPFFGWFSSLNYPAIGVVPWLRKPPYLIPFFVDKTSHFSSYPVRGNPVTPQVSAIGSSMNTAQFAGAFLAGHSLGFGCIALYYNILFYMLYLYSCIIYNII
jgi:hypothetical protein